MRLLIFIFYKKSKVYIFFVSEVKNGGNLDDKGMMIF